ncbi:tenascin-X isoform X3 [Cavia porcellus]|uniref:tenascin-X isoform X3 n=1 Tax=Cavia porcellus TaxID=10141 RepID=UPI002FE0799C
MPAQRPLTVKLVLLVLLGTAGAGPFPPRFNVTLPAPRPPPQPGGRMVGAEEGRPSSQHYEHTVEGGEKQVVFTHRINLPPSSGCGCSPGAEPPAPASEMQALRVRLEVLEALVKGLKEQCGAGCCPPAAQAGTGQTDVRSLCSLHGVFDLSRCACSCEPGWGGPTCSDPVARASAPSPPSAPTSCPDDCNDQGRCVHGRCVCFPGYTGPSCDRPSCPGDCQGRGRCVQGACVCRAGFTGPDCSQRACPRGCSQRGRCVDGRCACDPGYSGEDCGVRACARDCGEGGRCVDGRCECWPGYAGEDCGMRTCPRDCWGRGRCEDGECICDPGYTGDDCSVRACPGDCSQRGRCEDGRCVCWPGYTGPDCGKRACPRDCRGRGRCEDGVCVCHAGYAGEDCGVRTCPGDCRGRGRCESGRCVCWPGYTGRDCGTRTCPGDCRGRGHCEDGVCVCDPGFAGEDCGVRRCPGDCRGRGRCEDGVCMCHEGYTGEDCGVRRCPRDCSQRGVCRDGVCACWEGFAGEDCSTRACPSDCHRRGRCEDGVCVCDPGFAGPACAMRTCPGDCRGRGRCVQGTCVCHAGYSGEDCGLEEPPASACPGGCGPRELCRGGRCVCVEGFRGPDCAIQTCPGDCRGRGECRQGSCVCHDGFAGEDCGEEVPAVEGMRVQLLEETTVRTEWTRALGPVDAYEIKFIPTVEGGSPPFTARVPSSASAYDQRGLAPGQEYEVTVRALRGTSWGPPTSKTVTTMIDGPQDLRVVTVTPTTLELSWLRPLAEVDRFVVSYVSAGNQRVRLEVPPEADRELLTDLMPGVEYVVTVTAERGRAVSYPASVRANTAPAPYHYPEVRPPAPPRSKPRARPAPAYTPPPPQAKPSPAPSPSQPPRRAWGNLTGELGRFRGTVQDLERHLRARAYPLRANQTYAGVARHLHELLRRRLSAPAGSPAPPPRPAASAAPGTTKRDSSRGGPGPAPQGQGEGESGPVAAASRHPKPEVLGSSADGALLVSLDGLRGQFERVVLRWRPQPPAEGPGGELSVPGATRTVRLPDLRPGTTYHVEAHGVRAGRTSKSYAFVTTTGTSPLGATDEPPPAGPSTTQGAEARLVQRPQELGELRVLGRDETGRLHVAWTAEPDTFDHFRLHLQVPEGPGAHEELLPGDIREALVPPPPPGAPYTLLLHGVLPGDKPSVPVTYHGIMAPDEEEPRKPSGTPRLGELAVTTGVTSDSLLLRWTVPEGEFDSFVIQYKERDGPRVVPVDGPQRSALVTSLEPGRKYKFVLYGLVGKKRHGPLVAEAKILHWKEPSSGTPPRLGTLRVTDPTPDSLHLIWTVPEGQFDSFMVQYKDREGQPQVVPVEGPDRSVTVSPLDPDHKYRFSLFGVANKKQYGPLTAEGTTAPERREELPHPEAPEQPILGELTVAGVTPDSLRLSWTVARGPFDSFVVQYKDAQGQPQAVPVGADQSELTVPGLEPNRKYKMNLYGLRGRQRVGPASVVARTAPQETSSPTEPSADSLKAPEEPRLGALTVTGATADSLSLSWTVPEGQFDHFLVQYRNGDGQPKAVRVPGHENEVTVSGLEPDHKYKMHLYGFHGGQRVGPVSAVGVTDTEREETMTPALAEPPTTPEPAPEPRLGALTVTDASPNSLSLSWTIPEGQFDHFLVQYRNGDGQPKAVRVPGHKDEVTVSGLEPDHEYKMHLYGFHGGQRVGPVSVVGVTEPHEVEEEETPAPPEPPIEALKPPEEPLLGELTVTAASPDSLSLSWTVSRGRFDGFSIQYKDGAGRPQVLRVGGEAREATVQELDAGRRYKMNLYGLHQAGRVGPVSTVAETAPQQEVTPPATKRPLEPRLGELTVTEVTPDSVSLSWTVPEGTFDSFVVQYKDKEGQPQEVPVTSDQLEVTVPNLEPATKYQIDLYGLHSQQHVGPLSVVAETDPLPLAPTSESPLEPRLGELTVTDVTPDSVGLAWTVPEGEFDSFMVQYKDRDGQPQLVPVTAGQREVTVPGLEPSRKYKFVLFGIQDGKRHSPVSVEARTAASLASLPRLGELWVTDATPDALSLSWTVPEGHFDSFVVQFKSKDGPQVVPVEGHARSVTVSSLDAGRKYRFLLYGLLGRKRLGPLTADGTTEPLRVVDAPGARRPPKPRLGEELHVTSVTTDSVDLAWMVPEGQFDSFVVQYRDRDGQPQAVPVDGSLRAIHVSGLDPARRYKLLLYGLHGGKRVGPLSAIATTAPREDMEAQPETPSPGLAEPRLGELTVEEATPHSLRLSWEVTEGELDSFEIQYEDRDGRPQVVSIEGHQHSATLTGLESEHRYLVTLYGFHEGQPVGPVHVDVLTPSQEEENEPQEPPTTPEPAPEPRLGALTVTDASPDSLSLSWTVPEGQFDHFLVQYRNGDGQPKVLRVPGHEDEVTVSGLEPDHKYRMHLYGFHGGQRMGPVSAVGVTAPHEVEEEETPSPPGRSMEAPQPPEEPLLGELTVTAASPDSLSLSWTVSQGHFDGFSIQYKDGAGRPQVLRVGGEAREATVRELDAGRRYKMNLYGLHQAGRAGPVSAVAETASEPVPPTAPQLKPQLGALTVTGATADSLSLSWTVPEGQFDHFLVQYRNGDGQPKAVRVPGHENEVTVSGLEPDHKYKMHLYGFHGGQRVGPVSAVGVTDPEREETMTPALAEPPTTPEPAPEPRLGALTVTDASPNSLSLSWTVPEGQFDHFLVQYRNGDGQPKAVRVPGYEDEVTVSGLEPDHEYKMHLYGFHGGQRMGPVSAVGVTAAEEETPNPLGTSTEAPQPPEEPLLGELTVTAASPDSLSLSWTVSQGHFDGFSIQYKDGAGRPQVLRVGGEAREATVRELDAGRRYKMNLYGLHQAGRVGPVSTVAETEEDTMTTQAVPTTTPEPAPKPRLGALTVTDVSPNSLSLSWTIPEGQFDHFLVQYRNGDGQPKAVRVPGHEDEVTVSGLQPDHKYKMHLYGFHGDQRVGPVSVVGVTAAEEETPSPSGPSTEAPQPPEEPLLGELMVTSTSPDSLSLSWTVSQGHFDGFSIQYKDGAGRPQVLRVGGEVREATVQELEAGRRYKMNLYGLHQAGRVGPVSIVTETAAEEDTMTTQAVPITTPEPAPKPLLGELTVTDVSPDSLSLSWTVPEGQFDHFLVQYRNGDGQPKAVRVPGHEDEVTVSGLEPDHKYKMHLYGFHGGQRVGPVSVVGVTATEEETPGPPGPSTEAPQPPEEPLLGDLIVTGASPDSLSLSWTVSRGHFDGFSIQYKDGAGQPQVLRVGGEAREATVRELDAGRRYKMNLYGLHQAGRVGPVSTVAVTAPLPTWPAVDPRLGELAVAAVTSDTVSLSWTVAQGPFDSFLVQYRDAQGQLQVVPVSGDLHEVTISALHPARKYKFQVFGLRDGKRHGPVSVDTKTFPDTKPSPRLGELTVTDVTPDSVGLAWTVPEGEFDSFVVQYKDRDGQPQMVPVASDQREVTVPSLEPNRRYKFLLYGLVGRKRLGPASADGTTAPLEEAPQRPRLGELAASQETSDSLQLSWTVAQGSFDSFLVQYRDADGQLQVVPVAAEQREVTVEGLAPGRTYRFLLYGLSGGQRLGPVSTLGATAPEEDTPAPPEQPEPPEAPRLGLLAVTEATPDSLRLSWSVVRGPFNSFVVQYEGSDGQPQALLVDGDQSKVLVSGLEPGTSYKFFLYGLHDGKRQGPVSAEGTTGPPPAGQTPGDPGPRLSQLSVTDVTTSSLRLNWEAPQGAFDSFLLRFGVPAPSTLEPRQRPPLQRELMVPGTRRSAVLRDLRPGTLYSLTLYGLRGPHKADSVQGTARTLSPVLESPRDLEFSDIRETSATVSWTPPPSRVDSFKVSYQLADGGEPQSVQVDGRAQTHSLQGLTPGARYEVTVVSVRGFEESEPLEGFLSTIPDGPTQLRAMNLTEGSALLQWTPPQTPVDKYNVRVTGAGAPPLQGSAPGSAEDYALHNLVPQTNYTATVRGLRGPNLTSPASITFTAGLQGPQDLEAREVTPRTALLTWVEPQVPPTGYLVSLDTPGEQTQEILLPAGVTSHRLLGLFPSTAYSAQLRAMWNASFSTPLSTSFTTGGLRVPFPRDCGEEMQNGAGASRATTVFLNGNRERPLSVFCDMETDGGGWLVFQRRVDGSTDFWRDWEDYAHGFGNVSGEFWLGNEALHSLTQAGDYSLRVDLRAGDEAAFAQYDSFRVDSAAQHYRLHLEGFHGTAGDSMSYHSGSVFSARDRDPNNLLISCAVSYRGAWWYRNCHYANLNGLYGSTVDHQGVSWYHWKGFDFSVPFTEMKLRPRSYRAPARGG